MSALPIAQLIAVLALLLEATAGHVTFDSSARFENHGAYAEVGCTQVQYVGEPCRGRHWTVKVGSLRLEDAFAGRASERVTRLTLEAYIHELAHVYDGMHGGTVDGSPRAVEYYWRGQCATNAAERYACDVVRTGAP